MIRQDYIIRLIETFGILWARFIEQMRGGQIVPARLTLDYAYLQLFGLTPSTVTALSAGELLARMNLGVTPEAGWQQSLIMCALLHAEGDLALEQHQPEHAIGCYQKARDMLRVLEIGYPATPLPEYAPTVAELEDALAAVHQIEKRAAG
jgi:hypothetical protein